MDRLAPGLARTPAGARQEIGDRTQYIGFAVPDIAAAVAVEIDREAQVTGRHELRLSHCASIGPGHSLRRDITVIQDLQRRDQFFAKERAAPAGPGEGGERLYDLIVAGVDAEARFQAPDARDHRGSDAEIAFHLAEQGTILRHGDTAVADPLVADNEGAVLRPGHG